MSVESDDPLQHLTAKQRSSLRALVGKGRVFRVGRATAAEAEASLFEQLDELVRQAVAEEELDALQERAARG